MSGLSPPSSLASAASRHGGGGSGGSVLLQAYGQVIVDPGARITALGGAGAEGGESPPGGQGGAGRVRFEDADGVVEIPPGAVTPDPALGILSRHEDPDSEPEPREGWQIPGDLDQDGRLTVSDPVALLRVLFSGAAAPLPCDGNDPSTDGNLDLLDADGSGLVALSDALFVLNYLFRRGEAPVLGTGCVTIPGCPGVCSP